MAKARRGRIPKISPATAAEFCRHLEGGLSRKKAAALIGVDQTTICRWLRNSRDGVEKRLYANFAREVTAAEARFVAANVRHVYRAAKPRKVRVVKTTVRPAFDAAGVVVGDATTTETTERVEHDWQAAKWLLECKDREHFGPERAELAALRKELAEVRKLLTDRAGAVNGADAAVPTDKPA